MKRNAIIVGVSWREEDVWPPSYDFLAWREASEYKLLEWQWRTEVQQSLERFRKTKKQGFRRRRKKRTRKLVHNPEGQTLLFSNELLNSSRAAQNGGCWLKFWGSRKWLATSVCSSHLPFLRTAYYFLSKTLLYLLFSRPFFISPSKHPPSFFSEYCPGVHTGRWKKGYKVDGHRQKLATVIKINSRCPVILTFYSLKVSLERWKWKNNVLLVPTEFSSLVSCEPEWQRKDDPRPLLLLGKEISIKTLLHNLAQNPSLYVCNF